MKLNKDTKHSVKIGDRLRFAYGDCYMVTNVIQSADGRTVNFTIQDIKTKQTIYAQPSSKLYGAEIISEE